MCGSAYAVVWLCVASSAPALAAGRIDRVEPASWWVGMKDDRLQLLVHGTASRRSSLRLRTRASRSPASSASRTRITCS